MGEEEAGEGEGMMGRRVGNENKVWIFSSSYKNLKPCASLPRPVVGGCVTFYIVYPCCRMSYPFSFLYLALE